MAAHEPSVAELITSAIRDAQELVRGEIALAKAEAREEVRRVTAGAAMLAGAALAAVIGFVLLLTTAAWAISELLTWPVWAGFALVTLVTLAAAGALAFVGKRRISAERRMPRTMDTLKEHVQWMRARTS
jgi:membrane-bound ClpP family serine protease